MCKWLENIMYKLGRFEYSFNYKIFGIDSKNEYKKEGLDVDIFIGLYGILMIW